MDGTPDEDEVNAIRIEYRRSILEWEAAGAVSVSKANAIARTSRLYELRIRELAAGRLAIESLLVDPSTRVRAASAFQTLKWNPELALPVIKEIARRDKGLNGFEAEMVLKEYKAGRLDLDWAPKPRPQPKRKFKPTPALPRPSDQQLDAAVSVHSTTMSGGFLNSLVVSGPLFADAVVGYQGIGLTAAADLLRQVLAVLAPGELSTDHNERVAQVDGLSEGDAARLEDLGNQYQELFSSDATLFDAIQSASKSAGR